MKGFFERSLGGKELVRYVPAALAWLSDSARILTRQGENNRYGLTMLGLAATRAVLPLSLAAGLAQLIRDLLTLDPSDQLLSAWRPLDHLIALELLFGRSPRLRRFSSSLPEKLDAWIGAVPDRAFLLHREWISGPPGTSRACEVLGSLGIQPKASTSDKDEWAYKEAHSAVLRAVTPSRCRPL